MLLLTLTHRDRLSETFCVSWCVVAFCSSVAETYIYINKTLDRNMKESYEHVS